MIYELKPKPLKEQEEDEFLGDGELGEYLTHWYFHTISDAELLEHMKVIKARIEEKYAQPERFATHDEMNDIDPHEEYPGAG